MRRNLQFVWYLVLILLVWLTILEAWRHNLGWSIADGVIITLFTASYWDWKNNNGTQRR